ncbi:biopolymer transport protein ExbB [Chitinivorax tropicus]|uniref:Biopolymer transport protein ExbB n=1 Tax=Chitinivorax tropicus TaxID=714531 RepID=A0A840MR16_9PROT|nr:MotA/TolQ/ExbB proton channel family protein [Chitinivorax tropicus]MBB5019222.1 biopolymer transport protein ExbB [Chitinivorax tropicus]
MDLSLVFKQGDGVLITVFLLLLAMSVVSWCLILGRGALLWRIRQSNRDVQQRFWQAASWQAANQLIEHSASPLAALARSARDGLAHHRKHASQSLGKTVSLDDYLVRTLRNQLAQQNGRLERGLTWLATVGSTAPFIGLFGTVWGIYHALVGIATAGQASIGTVAGPIGEALIATAAGLAAAIPAVVAYNTFVRMNRVLAQEMDGFAHDLHAHLLTEAHDGVR